MRERGEIPFINFVRPSGRQQELVMSNIWKEDAEWLKANNVKVSSEDCYEFLTIYFDHGAVDKDGEPVEHLLIIRSGESCEDAMERGVQELKKIKGMST